MGDRGLVVLADAIFDTRITPESRVITLAGKYHFASHLLAGAWPHALAHVRGAGHAMGRVTRISRRRLMGRLAATGASAAGLVLLGGCALVPATSNQAKVPRVRFIGPSPNAPWVK